MENIQHLNERRLADAWAELQAQANNGTPLQADAYRLAFADPEFLLRRETRGLRFQLEMLKPDLAQQALGIENTIVVFGSARFRETSEAQAMLDQAQAAGDAQAIDRAKKLLRNAPYYDQAREFARTVARYSARCEQAGMPEDRLFICTGGGPGIMEAANRGAFEAGARSIGLNVTLPHEQEPNPFISPELAFRFRYFALRKMHFLLRARALVAFPGGYGTLDELFEVLTLVQTGKMARIPIVLVGREFWRRAVDFDYLVEEGFISAQDVRLFTCVDAAEEIVAVLEAFYGGKPPAPEGAQE
ncbi:TIGR00730 family Rossman fold protein [Hydrogenophaga sp.]|uniref:LOG family protein n=1 Tax=Hydrogenophaga sp. TaxID=1904254 RepID=UPI002732D72B|nr:TIGR00730 family Rossman fold protein [Hydrogenophaga sp.]MDP3475691.1 TIGR00730 family Rossman fold protein [Hydrogenophaga sp.]